ncbi:MAG: 2-amino-4-hydroxy-6-hydroxymethyldihydropteridine diphosphokinase [Acidimicrobiia bacterium]|nr:2-amino-4-hydroxy-6-hydroxymethyldihydropteridine diphosphokinase [Acidimicrobiia bacterium]MBT8217511.1 2-amino-4-hydroxy-6-hydroxymethyldihydropteridine diphosphokinase [Acidimicrobiia bacterium]NNF09033.1 2-amino-4-hydroxy-6-hydroxymethyldihydropteridine diphosphokinase [Acidimicrobiia bacterium]NNL70060.1 2-amino-4-hydroxy-6-hydroxymethyldihydropteridine diphosphokinase [Acidimicrobiia bacterium]
MVRVAIGFGSNLGDRRDHLDEARRTLARSWQLEAVSSLYESAPVGPVEQGPFLNAVATFSTDAPPTDVLARLLAVEQASGRIRAERWGPRTLDLDLLLYGREAIDMAGLTVPHPEIANRRFVLEPLLEIWPDASLPDGTALSSLRDGVDDQAVARIGAWEDGFWNRLLRSVRRAVGTGPR